MKAPFPPLLAGYRIHLVGIKGTGMAALAEILLQKGALLSGSDQAERFYTDRILQELGISYREKFDAEAIDSTIQLVVFSAAYDMDKHPELIRARDLGIPRISYPQAIGYLSERYDSNGVAGTHGKTTTTAMSGVLARALKLPATVLVGAEVAEFGGRSTLLAGDRFLIAETCEYRRHFLNFHPHRVIVTGVEFDHPDYFQDMEDMLSAYEAYLARLPAGGLLIYNGDDPGAKNLADRISRSDIEKISYGKSGDYRFESIEARAGEVAFRVSQWPKTFRLQLPGEHSAYNALAALILCTRIKEQWSELAAADLDQLQQALLGFRGIRRRSEVLGEAAGILFIDDYGHHPTEIEKTLQGFKAFYPDRRIVLDFMPHTYSRTQSLLGEFAGCFNSADIVVLHDVYASARERQSTDLKENALFKAVRANRQVHYFPAPADALPYFKETLQAGDLFITMGAGNNWMVGRTLFDFFLKDAS